MNSQRKLGRWASTSLVVGNMIGAGIFMMPALLSAYGGISMVGWMLSAFGAILVALMFSRLSKLAPGIQGGPYAFTRLGLGEFPSFLVAWGYWISVWTTNAALAAAFVSYLAIFLPLLTSHILFSVGAAILVLWSLSYYNTLGISKVGRLSLLTTIFKIIPILLVAIFGLFYFNIDHFSPLNLSQESNFMAIIVTITLTFFSFLGIESATIPAENIDNPKQNVPFATKWGTLIAAGIYMLSSFAILGMISPSELIISSAPFADAGKLMWGNVGQYLIAIGAIISVFGALNGWIFIQGQMPEAIANDNMFPKLFAKQNINGMPASGIYISSILASILIIMNYSGGLVAIFEFMVLVSTVCVLIPYLFCAIAFIIIQKRRKNTIGIQTLILGIGTFLFAIIALIGSGKASIIWGLVFLLCGIPVFIFLNRKKTATRS